MVQTPYAFLGENEGRINYEVIDSNYLGIKEFLGFDKAIEGYINKKVTGINSAIKSNLPDMYISISFDESPTIKTLKELVQQSIDRLKSSGYPITPDRYLTQFVDVSVLQPQFFGFWHLSTTQVLQEPPQPQELFK
jgi:hypothetical protein